MDQEHAATQTPVPHEWPVGLIVGFSAVFVVGFALVVAVLMGRRKKANGGIDRGQEC